MAPPPDGDKAREVPSRRLRSKLHVSDLGTGSSVVSILAAGEMSGD